MVAVWLLACSLVLSWSSVLTVPPVPSPKVTSTAVPPLNDVKLRVLPLMPPAPAVRAAVKLVSVPLAPVRPSAASALPVPVIDRSAVVPVLSFNVPLAETEEAAMPVAVVSTAAPLAFAAVLTPVARSMAFRVSAIVAPCR